MNKMRNVFLALTVLLISLCSLRAQSPLIPYRIGEKWGFSDVDKNIVIEPTYDSVFSYDHYPEGYYVVVNDGKWGVVTKHEVVVPTILNDIFFDYIGGSKCISGRTNCGQNCKMYYDLHGNQLFDKPVEEVNTCYYFDNLYIINYSDFTSDLVVFNDNGKPGVQNILLWGCKEIREWGRSTFKITKEDSTFYIKIINEGDGEYSVKKLKSSPPLIKPYPKSDVKLMVYEVTGKWNSYYKVKLGSENFQILEIKNEIFDNRVLDTLKIGKVNIKNAAIKHYKVLGLNSFKNGDRDYVKEKWKKEEYLLIKKRKRYGVISANGKIKPKFQEITGIVMAKVDRMYLVKKKGKYGVFTVDEEWKLNPEYDSIKFVKNMNVLICMKDGKYGLVEYNIEKQQFEKILEFTYSKIEVIDWKGLMIKKDNLYGYYSPGVMTKPIFKYKINGFTTFREYKVLELVDESGKLLGYAKPNGEFFFKEE